ncbi:hypothetical protein HDE76_000728 [Rhodanobacter sp. ANJX3]|uniref:hypothetical protein n=1 Tax=Rhodanobacter sp. ANJX3 TaxID=2723083 RepID=UPI001622247D|nr:hypothetical protein [Rhodanobacter sp. ANJX3]MBB5357546.1 hypothetical protein [Rhodanobacter sp. ANJX3]
MADTDSQGAVCVGIRDKPLAFDFDDEVFQAGSDLIGYGYSKGGRGKTMNGWTLLGNLLTNGLFLLVVKWLLDRNETKRVALFNAALGRQAFEHQTVYPRLHEKALEVVTQSLVLLSRFTQEVIRYTDLTKGISGGPTDEEGLPEVVDALNNFRTYFYGNRIYLPKQAADEIDKQVLVLVGTANVYLHMVHKRTTNGQPVDWQMISSKINDDMLPASKELERIYRTLVSIEAVFPGFALPEGHSAGAVLGSPSPQ